MATSDEAKARRYREAKQRFLSYLDAEVPKLHREGWPGATAVSEAKRRYAKVREGAKARESA